MDEMANRIDCGHADASIETIEIGERREGGEWKVTRVEYEIHCDTCGPKPRFSIEPA
jgi:hypothetical protein